MTSITVVTTMYCKGFMPLSPGPFPHCTYIFHLPVPPMDFYDIWGVKECIN